jgi:hypothetical protein
LQRHFLHDHYLSLSPELGAHAITSATPSSESNLRHPRHVQAGCPWTRLGVGAGRRRRSPTALGPPGATFPHHGTSSRPPPTSSASCIVISCMSISFGFRRTIASSCSIAKKQNDMSICR